MKCTPVYLPGSATKQRVLLDERDTAVYIPSMLTHVMMGCLAPVNRQLWKKNPAQFLVVVSPLISQYVTMIRIQSKNSDFDTVAKMAIRQRRKAPEVAELVKCVGEEFNLYLALLQVGAKRTRVWERRMYLVLSVAAGWV